MPIQSIQRIKPVSQANQLPNCDYHHVLSEGKAITRLDHASFRDWSGLMSVIEEDGVILGTIIYVPAVKPEELFKKGGYVDGILV